MNIKGAFHQQLLHYYHTLLTHCHLMIFMNMRWEILVNNDSASEWLSLMPDFHTCRSMETNSSSDNGLWHAWYRAIIWLNADLLSIGPILETNLSFYSGLDVLTHWGRDKMATKFLTTFSNAFSWMKKYKFQLGLHWSLFLITQTPVSGSFCLPLGALQSMWATWCKI